MSDSCAYPDCKLPRAFASNYCVLCGARARWRIDNGNNKLDVTTNPILAVSASSGWCQSSTCPRRSEPGSLLCSAHQIPAKKEDPPSLGLWWALQAPLEPKPEAKPTTRECTKIGCERRCDIASFFCTVHQTSWPSCSMWDCSLSAENGSLFCTAHQIGRRACGLSGCLRPSELASLFCTKHQLPWDTSDSESKWLTPRSLGSCGMPGCGIRAEPASIFCSIHQLPKDKDDKTEKSRYKCKFESCERRANLASYYCPYHQVSEQTWCIYRHGLSL